jgi:zinc transport system substrate-binding protein
VKPRLVALVIVVATAVVACGEKDSAKEGPGAKGAPVVMTTFYPTTYFVQRIGGDRVRVVCPLPADADPIFWNPTDEDVAAYQAADLIVVNGGQFEKWVAKVSLPEEKVVDTAKAFEDDLLKFKNAVTHAHGPSGLHAHEGVDGHTWLDPEQAKVQAAAIRDALKKLLPEDAAEFDAGYGKLAADLDALNASFAALAKDYDGHAIYASHPAYNYFARRYGVNVVNLNLDPGEMPDADTFAKIKEKLAAEPASFILWESEPLAEIAARFQDELGLTSLTFSPCEMMDPADLATGANYLSVMKANAAVVKLALRPKSE